MRVSLSLEKLSELPEKPMRDVLKWLETEHPSIRGLHFGDVNVDVNRTPALFVADKKELNVYKYTLVYHIGTNHLLTSIKPESGDCRGGLLPVLNSKYLLVREANDSKYIVVSLYK